MIKSHPISLCMSNAGRAFISTAMKDVVAVGLPEGREPRSGGSGESNLKGKEEKASGLMSSKDCLWILGILCCWIHSNERQS